MKPLAFSSLVSVIVLAAGAALAQSEVDPAIDTDGDGAYSFPEMTAVYTDMTAEDFATLDTSGDGLIDMDEMAAAEAAGLLPAIDG